MSSRTHARPYAAVFLVLVVLLVGALCYVVLRPFLTAIAWGAILAVALWPLWRRVKKRLSPRTTLAAALFTVSAGLVVLLPGVLLGAAIVNQASAAAKSVAETLRARDLRSLEDVRSSPIASKAIAWAQERTGLSAEEIQARVAELAARASKFLAAESGILALSFLDAVMTFVLTLFLLFFLLVDGEDMVEALSDLLPIEDADRHKIVKSLGGMMESIFKGSLVCAFVQGACGGFSWLVAGLPSPVLAGVAMGILSLLPLGGTAIVWLPGLVALFIQGRNGMAIFFLLWNVIVTSTLADNVLKPLLIGGKDTEMSTLMVFLGVFGGIATFGLLGVFIGPIALAVGLMVVRVLRTLAREARVSESA